MPQNISVLVLALVVLLTTATTIVTTAASASPLTCQSYAATIVGTEAADDLIGTPGRDIILGLGGDDDLQGFGGDDVLCGGAGADVLRGGAGDDSLLGEDGADLLAGGSGDDGAPGGAGQDLCALVEHHNSCRPVQQDGLATTGLAATADTVVTLRGFVRAGATTRIYGAAAPATAVADSDGVFEVETLLHPGRSNALDVTATVELSSKSAGSNGQRTRLLRQQLNVEQLGAAGGSRVSGRVVDPEGRPVPGVRVAYGAAYALSAADGTYQLEGLPRARMAIRATASGFLGGLATVDTTMEPTSGGTQVDILMQPFAAPVTVDARGGTFSGLGYRVVVPRGAVDRPTALHITPLLISGDKDGYGVPIVDLSPAGQRFLVPITVELDPAVVGMDATDVGVAGHNPDSGVAFPLASRIVAARLQVSLRELDGVELRLPTDLDDLVQQCVPYNPIVAGPVRQYYRERLPAFLLVMMGLDSSLLYTRYLAGGEPVQARRTLTHQGLVAFGDARQTTEQRAKVVEDLKDAIAAAPVPPLAPPALPTELRVEDYGVGQNLEINYIDIFTVPGNIAGGIGHSSTVLGAVRDSRVIDGPVRFVPEADERGVLTRVEAQADLQLTVLDSIDFCQGRDVGVTEGDAGGGIERFATIALSRLEMTRIPLTRGTFATPQLFVADPTSTGRPTMSQRATPVTTRTVTAPLTASPGCAVPSSWTTAQTRPTATRRTATGTM